MANSVLVFMTFLMPISSIIEMHLFIQKVNYIIARPVTAVIYYLRTKNLEEIFSSERRLFFVFLRNLCILWLCHPLRLLSSIVTKSTIVHSPYKRRL